MSPLRIAASLAVVLATGSGCTREMFCGPCPVCDSTVASAVKGSTTIPPVPPACTPSARSSSDVPKAQSEDAVVVAPPPPPEAPLPNGRVRNAKEYFSTLEHRFQPGASKDLHAVFQFDLSGAEACAYHVAVDDGVMKMEQGRADKADVTIAASAEDYVKVVNGELSGVGAVMNRKMKVGGNLTLARRMKKLFPGGAADK